MKDIEIIELFFNRDEMAIKETERSYGSALLSMSSRMVPLSDAQECVNDTYMAAWNSIPPTRPARFFAWLAKTCRNIVCDRIDWNNAAKRNADTLSISSELEEIISGTDSAQFIDYNMLGEAISAHLHTLPKDARAMFIRRYFYSQSIKEVARAMGSTESRVKTTLHRVRASLKDHLIKEGYEI